MELRFKQFNQSLTPALMTLLLTLCHIHMLRVLPQCILMWAHPCRLSQNYSFAERLQLMESAQQLSQHVNHEPKQNAHLWNHHSGLVEENVQQVGTPHALLHQRHVDLQPPRLKEPKQD